MMYRVRVERKAQKKLSKIPEPYYSNLKNAILNLGNDPYPKGFKKLKGQDAYRIIYEIYDDVLLVDVFDLGHRKEIYK